MILVIALGCLVTLDLEDGRCSFVVHIVTNVLIVKNEGTSVKVGAGLNGNRLIAVCVTYVVGSIGICMNVKKMLVCIIVNSLECKEVVRGTATRCSDIGVILKGVHGLVIVDLTDVLGIIEVLCKGCSILLIEDEVVKEAIKSFLVSYSDLTNDSEVAVLVNLCGEAVTEAGVGCCKDSDLLAGSRCIARGIKVDTALGVESILKLGCIRLLSIVIVGDSVVLDSVACDYDAGYVIAGLYELLVGGICHSKVLEVVVGLLKTEYGRLKIVDSSSECLCGTALYYDLRADLLYNVALHTEVVLVVLVLVAAVVNATDEYFYRLNGA